MRKEIFFFFFWLILNFDTDLEVKIKFPKLWYILCFSFAFYSLDTLVEEGHQVVYGRGKETDPLSYLVCVKLADIYYNKTVIDLKELKDDLYRHFSSLTSNERFNRVNRVNRVKNRLSNFKNLILNRTMAGNYLVFDGRICLVAKKRRIKRHEIFFII